MLYINSKTRALDLKTYLPKPYEVRQARSHNKQTVYQCISKEQHEELVVMEADAVVDPGAMVVHLKDAPLAD